MNKVVKLYIIGFLLLAISAAGLGVYLAKQYALAPAGTSDEKVIYEVKSNIGFKSVAQDLENLNVVKNASLFSLLARLTHKRGQMKTGEYEFRKNMTPMEVLAILISGRSIERSFTVPEGFNIFDIAGLVEKLNLGTKQEFLTLCRDPEFIQSLMGEKLESLEGYLFPETYQYTKFSTLRELVKNMVKRFLYVYSEVEKTTPTPMNFNRHQVVTFASLVEKETGSASDRPIIASVFFNRLRKGMRLQTDPTILYGMAIQKGEMPTNITKADILRPTPYNTYVISGLPPGPITNPGRGALTSVFVPQETDYLFFVSRNDGTTVFSRNYENHNKAVLKYQVDKKEREGKSWRDLESVQKTNGP